MAQRASAQVPRLGRLSVVIANYNYEQYVGAAIESALALDWDDVEVVVVDDGSTDGSVEVISSYADRVTVLVTENATQRVAANRGYERCTGDVVVFLDSDDVLPAELPARLAEVFTPTVAKVQFQMQRIDGIGTPVGSPFPRYDPVPSADDIRRWALRTSAYPTPPGSGNAYARWFLDAIFPLVPEVGDASDSACLAAAPFFGDVVTVPGTCVGYRRHDANDSFLLADASRFRREVVRARARWRFAQQAAGVPCDDRPLHRSRELLQLRVAARRAGPEAPGLPGDGLRRLLVDTIRSPFHAGPDPIPHRLVVLVWCLATLAAPRRWVGRLLTARYGRR